MNSIWILILAFVWFFLGYRIYGKFISKKIGINDKNKTPASSKKGDGDFSPAKKPLLIGHHFEAIAGAGPIVGPILAVSYFGWLPVILWISLGSVLIGAMHDYISLIASVRNKSKGVSSIAKNIFNSKAGTLFSVMILVTLTLIVTVFSVSTAESIANKTELIIGGETFNTSCPSGKGKECFSNLNISDYNNLSTFYYFNLTDVAGNVDESRATKIKVDTTSPKVTRFENWIIGKYAYFNLTIDESNFDTVEYKENYDSRWKTLCSSLKNNVCYKKLYFKTGNHNIIVRVLDEAGNSYSKEINFII